MLTLALALITAPSPTDAVDLLGSEDPWLRSWAELTSARSPDPTSVDRVIERLARAAPPLSRRGAIQVEVRGGLWVRRRRTRDGVTAAVTLRLRVAWEALLHQPPSPGLWLPPEERKRRRRCLAHDPVAPGGLEALEDAARREALGCQGTWW